MTTTGAATTAQPTIRAVRPGDTDTLHAVFAQLSPRSVYLRFHTGLPRLTPGMTARLTDVVPGRHEVLVAEHAGRPVGLARWIRDRHDPEAVEVAVEVADAVQGRGIGRALLRAALVAARAGGASVVLAHVHPDNARVLAWLERLGATRPTGPDEPYRLELRALSGPCGCMAGCRSGCSGPSAWGTTAAVSAAPSRCAANAPVRSSPSCSRAAAGPSRPRSSSTSCGVATPA